MDVSSWSPQDVQQWLVQKGWEECIEYFAYHQIDGTALLNLKHEDLKRQLTIPDKTRRKNLWKDIASLQPAVVDPPQPPLQVEPVTPATPATGEKKKRKGKKQGPVDATQPTEAEAAAAVTINTTAISLPQENSPGSATLSTEEQQQQGQQGTAGDGEQILKATRKKKKRSSRKEAQLPQIGLGGSTAPAPDTSDNMAASATTQPAAEQDNTTVEGDEQTPGTGTKKKKRTSKLPPPISSFPPLPGATTATPATAPEDSEEDVPEYDSEGGLDDQILKEKTLLAPTTESTTGDTTPDLQPEPTNTDDVAPPGRTSEELRDVTTFTRDEDQDGDAGPVRARGDSRYSNTSGRARTSSLRSTGSGGLKLAIEGEESQPYVPPMQQATSSTSLASKGASIGYNFPEKLTEQMKKANRLRLLKATILLLIFIGVVSTYNLSDKSGFGDNGKRVYEQGVENVRLEFEGRLYVVGKDIPKVVPIMGVAHSAKSLQISLDAIIPALDLSANRDDINRTDLGIQFMLIPTSKYTPEGVAFNPNWLPTLAPPPPPTAAATDTPSSPSGHKNSGKHTSPTTPSPLKPTPPPNVASKRLLVSSKENPFSDTVLHAILKYPPEDPEDPPHTKSDSVKIKGSKLTTLSLLAGNTSPSSPSGKDKKKDVTSFILAVSTNVDVTAMKLHYVPEKFLTKLSQYIGMGILVFVMVLIFSGLLDKVVALMVGTLMALSASALVIERISLTTVLMWIDLDLLTMVFSMMLTMTVISSTGGFEFAAVRLLALLEPKPKAKAKRRALPMKKYKKKTVTRTIKRKVKKEKPDTSGEENEQPPPEDDEKKSQQSDNDKNSDTENNKADDEDKDKPSTTDADGEKPTSNEEDEYTDEEVEEEVETDTTATEEEPETEMDDDIESQPLVAPKKGAQVGIVKLVIILILITMVLSAFVDNVIVALIMIHFNIHIAKVMRIQPEPLIMMEIFFCNIAGALTSFSDPTNLMLAYSLESRKQLSRTMNEWVFTYHIIGCGVITAVIIYVLLRFYMKELHQRVASMQFALHREKQIATEFYNYITLERADWGELRTVIADRIQDIDIKLLMNKSDSDVSLNIPDLKKAHQLKDTPLFVVGVVFLFLVIVLYAIHPMLGELVATSLSWISLVGATAVVVVVDTNVVFHILNRVDWYSLLFIAVHSLFTNAISALNVFLWIGDKLVQIQPGNFLVGAPIFLWTSAIFGSVCDNVIYTRDMVNAALGSEYADKVAASPVFFYCLVIGVAYGANATLIGGYANVVASGAAQMQGVPISHWRFCKYGLVVAAVSLVVASGYVIVLSVLLK